MATELEEAQAINAILQLRIEQLQGVVRRLQQEIKREGVESCPNVSATPAGRSNP